MEKKARRNYTQFFNPLKFGATKIGRSVMLHLQKFFNPLKFGATKMQRARDMRHRAFFNPLKFGATKITCHQKLL